MFYCPDEDTIIFTLDSSKLEGSIHSDTETVLELNGGSVEGSILLDKPQTDLTGYATESYVNQQLEAYNVFANYKTQNVDEDGLLTYVGKQKPTGEWLIERYTASGDDIVVQYANLSNNIGYTYSTAWTARAGLTYNFINVLTGL